jgi:hypothetical protein
MYLCELFGHYPPFKSSWAFGRVGFHPLPQYRLNLFSKHLKSWVKQCDRFEGGPSHPLCLGRPLYEHVSCSSDRWYVLIPRLAALSLIIAYACPGVVEPPKPKPMRVPPRPPQFILGSFSQIEGSQLRGIGSLRRLSVLKTVRACCWPSEAWEGLGCRSG